MVNPAMNGWAIFKLMERGVRGGAGGWWPSAKTSNGSGGGVGVGKQKG